MAMRMESPPMRLPGFPFVLAGWSSRFACMSWAAISAYRSGDGSVLDKDI